MSYVLVIEDNDDIRENVVELLETEMPWLRVGTAADGLQALEVLEGGDEPCLALLDIMMPRMNGLELLDALRERKLAQGMRIVLVSGYVELAHKVEYPGILGLLPKPFRTEDLLRFVGQACPRDSTPS